MKKTKIVATISPKSGSKEMIKKLSKAGVNVFRLNFSHGIYEEHGKQINIIREADVDCAIMLDTKGPEIRTGEVRYKVFLKVGDKFTMTINGGVYEDTGKISVNYKDFIKDVNVGDVIVFDSGVMHAKAIKKTSTDIDFIVTEGQTNITTKRHINLFGKPVSLPTITEQDWKDIEFGISKDVDMIALSFVKSGKDAKSVKDYCTSKGHSNIQIISKIENFESTQNLEDIIIESDGIMVARGDLACEIPFSKVPAVQKKKIALRSYYKKPLIIATQMLLSMVENIQPTRAEVSDVANAVFEHVDAIMTSDETTKGNDPVNVINVMSKIAIDTEKEIYCNDTDDNHDNEFDSIVCYPSRNELIPAFSEYVDDADAIVVISDNPTYVNSVASMRTNLPIISFSSDKTLVNNQNLVWNTESKFIKISDDWVKNLELVSEKLEKDYKKFKNLVIIFEIDGNLTIQVRNIKKNGKN